MCAGAGKGRETGGAHTSGHRQGRLEVCEQGILALAIDGKLGEHGEVGLVAAAGAHVLESGQELLVALVGLVAELVAGEGQHHQGVAERLRQGIQLLEVPDGRASEGCDVLDHDHLTLVGAHGSGHPVCHRVRAQ